MSRSQRDKGKRGELEARALIRRHFEGAAIARVDIERTPNSGGLSFKGDLHGIPDHHLEIKRTERLDLPAAWRQATDDCQAHKTAAVMHRRNEGEWLLTVRAEDYWGYLAELVALREAAAK